MSLKKIPWYYKIFSFQNNHTLIIYIIMNSISSSLKKIQFQYISNSWIWAQITADKYCLQLSFLIAFQLEVFCFKIFGMNKTKMYMCSGYVSVLTVTQKERKEKNQEFLLEEKSQQFQFKSIRYFLLFKHGIQLIKTSCSVITYLGASYLRPRHKKEGKPWIKDRKRIRMLLKCCWRFIVRASC